jgi:hypothetical protein
LQLWASHISQSQLGTVEASRWAKVHFDPAHVNRGADWAAWGCPHVNCDKTVLVFVCTGPKSDHLPGTFFGEKSKHHNQSEIVAAGTN